MQQTLGSTYYESGSFELWGYQSKTLPACHLLQGDRQMNK